MLSRTVSGLVLYHSFSVLSVSNLLQTAANMIQYGPSVQIGALLELLWRWNKQPNWIMLQQMMTLLPTAFDWTPIINTTMTWGRGREARECTHSMSSPAKNSFILKTSCNKYHIFRNLTIDAKNLNINLVIYVEVGDWMLCLMIKHRKEGLQLAE
jgi:hypothetical protein